MRANLPLQSEDVLREIGIAFRNISIYSSSHPASIKSLENAYEKIKTVLKETSSIELGIADDAILFNGKPISSRNPLIRKIIQELGNRSIGTVIIKPGVSLKELTSFFEVLSERDEEFSFKEFLKKLKAVGISDIQVTQTSYKKVSNDEDLIEDELVLRYLQEVLLNKLPSLKEETVLDKKQLPFIIDSFIKEQGEELARKPTLSNIMQFNQVLVKTGEIASGKKTLTWKDIRREIVLSIFMMDSEAKERLFGLEEFRLNNIPWIKKTLIEDIEPDVLAKTVITAFFQKGERRQGEFFNFIRNVIEDHPNKDAIASQIALQAENMGIPREKIEQLQSELFWESRSVEEIVAEINNKKFVDVHDLEKILIILPKLLLRSDKEPIQQILRRFVGALNDKRKRNRLYVLRNMARIRDLLNESKQFKEIDRTIAQVLTQFIRREKEPELLKEACKALSVISSALIERGDIETVSQIIKSIKECLSRASGISLKDIAEGFFSLNDIEKLISIATNKKDPSFMLAQNLIVDFPYQFIEFLLKELAEEASMSRRAILIGLLRKIGKDIIPYITPYLSDERWYVVRNCVLLLAETKDPSVLPLLAMPLSHPDKRVRVEAINAIIAINGTQSFKYLLDALNDPEMEIQEKAVAGLGHTKNKKAIRPLIEVIKKSETLGRQKGKNLKMTAIEALGNLGYGEAVPVLKKIATYKKSLLGRSEPTDIRHLAVKSIRKIQTPESKDALLELIKTEPNATILSEITNALGTMAK